MHSGYCPCCLIRQFHSWYYPCCLTMCHWLFSSSMTFLLLTLRQPTPHGQLHHFSSCKVLFLHCWYPLILFLTVFVISNHSQRFREWIKPVSIVSVFLLGHALCKAFHNCDIKSPTQHPPDCWRLTVILQLRLETCDSARFVIIPKVTLPESSRI